jgi:hypothetical protein
VVVVANVIVHTSFELRTAIEFGKAEELGLERAEEALDGRVVKAVAFATRPLRDAVARKHRPTGLHLVVPGLIGMHDQPSGVFELGRR